MLFFERSQVSDSALLVHISFTNVRIRQSQTSLEEFKLLVAAAGLTILAVFTGNRTQPDKRYFVGSGKLSELKDVMLDYKQQAHDSQANEVPIVIFNHTLTPIQERNIERKLKCRVLDRNALILMIFAQRARSSVGKLQVELAQLEHLATRLVRGWTHLERQKGGIGLRGGPGETQLEVDRRVVRSRIKVLQRRLAKVKAQRAQNRMKRLSTELPTVSLVGYTNAGKSTLFNFLTDAAVFSADQLFATLDPTVRRMTISGVGPVVLVDTVGFISELPQQLIAAFQATLEETRLANLLLHVVDVTADNTDQMQQQVVRVLEDINAQDVPQLLVYNKQDLMSGAIPDVVYGADGLPRTVWVSSKTGIGIDTLLAAIARHLMAKVVKGWLRLSPKYSRLRAALYNQDVVVAEAFDSSGNILLEVYVAEDLLRKVLVRESLCLDQVMVEPIPK